MKSGIFQHRERVQDSLVEGQGIYKRFQRRTRDRLACVPLTWACDMGVVKVCRPYNAFASMVR